MKVNEQNNKRVVSFMASLLARISSFSFSTARRAFCTLSLASLVVFFLSSFGMAHNQKKRTLLCLVPMKHNTPTVSETKKVHAVIDRKQRGRKEAKKHKRNQSLQQNHAKREKMNDEKMNTKIITKTAPLTICWF